MNIAETRRQLHEMAHYRLFGDSGWPADRETVTAVWNTFGKLGLEEAVPGGGHDHRYTAQGRACDIELFATFMGVIEPWDMTFILEENGLIDEEELDEIWEMPNEGEAVEKLKAAVVKSYYALSNQQGLLN